MQLKSLSVTGFKNHRQLTLEPDRKIVCITGANATGKTNLLDAIYFTCIGKSYFNIPDHLLIHTNGDFFRIEAEIRSGGKSEKLLWIQQRNKRKQLFRNNVPEEKLTSVVGEFPVVMVTPDDHTLIHSGPEARRKFLDYTLSQVSRTYLTLLIQYNKVLAQRNAALRRFAESGSRDYDLIESYNRQLIDCGEPVWRKRQNMTDGFAETFRTKYNFISGGSESSSLRYSSALQQHDFGTLLRQSLEKDLLFQRTTEGVHQDELEFLIDEQPVKRFASQGQQKTFLASLKLAQYDFIATRKKIKPLLLLDDLHDRFDSQRLAALTDHITSSDYGQVFVTDTQAARNRHLFEYGAADVRFTELSRHEISIASLREANE